MGPFLKGLQESRPHGALQWQLCTWVKESYLLFRLENETLPASRLERGILPATHLGKVILPASRLENETLSASRLERGTLPTSQLDEGSIPILLSKIHRSESSPLFPTSHLTKNTAEFTRKWAPTHDTIGDLMRPQLSKSSSSWGLSSSPILSSDPILRSSVSSLLGPNNARSSNLLGHHSLKEISSSLNSQTSETRS